MADWQVRAITPDNPLWWAYLEHLSALRMRYAAVDGDNAKPDHIYLGVATEDHIIGHLSFRVQTLIVPPSPLSQNQPVTLKNTTAQAIKEAFVASFAVLKTHRRQGIGRALQQAALEHAKAHDCYQLRSWSSIDKSANYALKLQLGFAVHPALFPIPGSDALSGVFFVKRLRDTD